MDSFFEYDGEVLKSATSKNVNLELANKRTISCKENTNFMPFQSQKWEENFHKLLVFKRNYGAFPCSKSCNDNILLGWIKRQRCQYKYFQKGQKSTMTKETYSKAK